MVSAGFGQKSIAVDLLLIVPGQTRLVALRTCSPSAPRSSPQGLFVLLSRLLQCPTPKLSTSLQHWPNSLGRNRPGLVRHRLCQMSIMWAVGFRPENRRSGLGLGCGSVCPALNLAAESMFGVPARSEDRVGTSGIDGVGKLSSGFRRPHLVDRASGRPAVDAPPPHFRCIPCNSP